MPVFEKFAVAPPLCLLHAFVHVLVVLEDEYIDPECKMMQNPLMHAGRVINDGCQCNAHQQKYACEEKRK
jgi:hypothetical protein